MTWFIIAPDHKVATGWMKDHYPEVSPYATADVKIVTPNTAEKLQGVQLREGDRLIRINDDWLPPTPGTASLNQNIAWLSAKAPVEIKTEWIEW